MKGMFKAFRNRFNPNLYLYETIRDRLHHTLAMRRAGKSPRRRWSEVGSDGVKRYFAEYGEIAKA